MKNKCFLLLVIILTITPIFAQSNYYDTYTFFRYSPTLESNSNISEPSVNFYNEWNMGCTILFPNENHGLYIKDTMYLSNDINLIGGDLGVSFKHKLLDNLNIFTSPYIALSMYDKSFINYYLGVGCELAFRYKLNNNFLIETGAEAKALFLIYSDTINTQNKNFKYSINSFIGLTIYLDLPGGPPSNVVYVHLV